MNETNKDPDYSIFQINLKKFPCKRVIDILAKWFSSLIMVQNKKFCLFNNTLILRYS